MQYYTYILPKLRFLPFFGAFCLFCLLSAGCAIRDDGMVYVHERPNPLYWEAVDRPEPRFYHEHVNHDGQFYRWRHHR